MPKGITPTRVRRRQSDAKWRASVAMCYNIMKNVIPNQKKLGRRKVSKALTLKETERHIVNLERKLKEIMEERAPMSGKVVMVERDNHCLYPATFEDIKKDFAMKQLTFFASNTGTGKKRYNIPADIEASLENVSKQSCRLVILNRMDVKSGLPQMPKLFRTSKEKSQSSVASCHSSKLETLLTVPLSNRHDIRVARQHKTPSKHGRHPQATYIRTKPSATVVTTPVLKSSKGPTTPGTPSIQGNNSFSTPSKACKQLPFSQSSGFTPVKLPIMTEEEVDPMLSFPTTPAKSSFESPFSCFSMPETPSSCFNGVEYFEFTDEEEVANLLCTETIDTMDLDGCHGSKTPVSKTHDRTSTITIEALEESGNYKKAIKGRSESKCRRRLDQSYQEDNDDQTVPSMEQAELTRNTISPSDNQLSPSEDTSCLEFDGYMLFYRHHVGNMDPDTSSADKALTVTKLWESLESYDRSVYAHMASLDYSEDSNDLSADLVAIDLKPLHKEHALKPEPSPKSDDGQEVPDLSFDLSTMSSHNDDLDLVHNDFDLHLVQGYEDLGIIYNEDDSIDNLKMLKYNPLSTGYKEEEEEDNQLVPELNCF